MAVNATAVWRVRPSGSNTNGGGFDAGISGAGTDYSQQNAAQASGTNGACTTSTFTDATAAAFTSAMVGNAMYITGGGATAGFYFVVTYTSASVVVLDRSPGASVSGATWYLGGGWADFWTNCQNGSTPIVPGNTVYILGTGSPTPSSYGSPDYTVGGYFTLARGSSAGMVTFANDPSTPTGGRPLVKQAGLFIYQCSYNIFDSIYFFTSSASNGRMAGAYSSQNQQDEQVFKNCVFDQNGYLISFFGGASAADATPTLVIGCELFSSTAPVSVDTTVFLVKDPSSLNAMRFIGNNVHDTMTAGFHQAAASTALQRIPDIIGNVFSNINGGVIRTGGATSTTSWKHSMIVNNTFDACKGNAIEYVSSSDIGFFGVVYNNMFTNITYSGAYAITCDAGTTAGNRMLPPFLDYNVFYNNTQNYNAISGGPHDTQLSTNPYVGQSTENFTLA